jgi:hypothetical protein
MFEPQVTLNEMGTPDSMLRSPADAITTAVVDAAMRFSLSPGRHHASPRPRWVASEAFGERRACLR